MSTYDPARPDPVHRVRPRRERVAMWLYAALAVLIVLAWTVPVTGWPLTALAAACAALAVTAAALILFPPPTARPAEPDHGEEDTP